MKTGRVSNYADGKYSGFINTVYARYGSIREFCNVIGLNQSNLNSNLDDRYRMSMERMFLCANALQIPVSKMIEWFWSDELEQNRKCEYSC